MKVKLPQVVHYRQDDYNNKPEYMLFASDMSGCSSLGFIKVCDTIVEIEIPDDFDPIAAQVQALQQEEKKLSEEFQRSIARVREQISKLQALTYSPATDNVPEDVQ